MVKNDLGGYEIRVTRYDISVGERCVSKILVDYKEQIWWVSFLSFHTLTNSDIILEMNCTC